MKKATAKPKQDKKVKPQEPVTTNKTSFDEVMTRLVRVKPEPKKK